MSYSGAERIANERQRQVEAEGYGPERDDEYVNGELVGAALSYAEAAFRTEVDGYPAASMRPHKFFQWPNAGWKPADDPIRNLEKAGALIAAEIDRLLRRRGSEAAS